MQCAAALRRIARDVERRDSEQGKNERACLVAGLRIGKYLAWESKFNQEAGQKFLPKPPERYLHLFSSCNHSLLFRLLYLLGLLTVLTKELLPLGQKAVYTGHEAPRLRHDVIRPLENLDKASFLRRRITLCR